MNHQPNLPIHIPNPCSVPLDTMDARTDGHFCQQCQTLVVDFTKLSDEEIFEFFRTWDMRKGDLCISQRASRLSNESGLSPKTSAMPTKLAVAAALGAAVLLPACKTTGKTTTTDGGGDSSQNTNESVPKDQIVMGKVAHSVPLIVRLPNGELVKNQVIKLERSSGAFWQSHTDDQGVANVFGGFGDGDKMECEVGEGKDARRYIGTISNAKTNAVIQLQPKK